MKVVYRLVGYSKKTDRMVAKYDVPPLAIDHARAIAGIPADDDGLGDYPLDSKQTNEIGRLLRIPVDANSVEFFLEPYIYTAEEES